MVGMVGDGYYEVIGVICKRNGFRLNRINAMRTDGRVFAQPLMAPAKSVDWLLRGLFRRNCLIDK
jgi:hypothetical protein